MGPPPIFYVKQMAFRIPRPWSSKLKFKPLGKIWQYLFPRANLNNNPQTVGPYNGQIAINQLGIPISFLNTMHLSCNSPGPAHNDPKVVMPQRSQMWAPQGPQWEFLTRSSNSNCSCLAKKWRHWAIPVENLSKVRKVPCCPERKGSPSWGNFKPKHVSLVKIFPKSCECPVN